MISDLIRSMISNMIDESIRNRQYWVQLPADQQQILDEILEKLHDIATDVNKICSNEHKVLPQYRAQFTDAMAIKLATELGMMDGGKRQ